MLPEQQEMFAIDSPCIGICEVNNKGFCKGCFRSRDERLYWHTLNTTQRGLLLTVLAKRRMAYIRKQNNVDELSNHPSNIQGNLFD